MGPAPGAPVPGGIAHGLPCCPGWGPWHQRMGEVPALGEEGPCSAVCLVSRVPGAVVWPCLGGIKESYTRVFIAAPFAKAKEGKQRGPW